MSVTINKRDLDRLISKLDDLAEMNFKKPLQKSSVILTQEIQRNFDTQGAIYQGGGFVRTTGVRARTRSAAWKPLAESTRKQRESLGFNAARPILERTGRLRKGFRVVQLTSKEMSIENKVPYAMPHQEGTRRMPQRIIGGFSIKSKAAILLVFAKHIAGLIIGKASTL